jgi:hypothetical protein
MSYAVRAADNGPLAHVHQAPQHELPLLATDDAVSVNAETCH